MELRGIGVIDVRRLFGMGAIKMNQQIDLVIKLEPWDDNAVYDRLGLENTYTEILGVQAARRDHPGEAGPEPGQHRGGGGHEQPQPARWATTRRWS